MVALPEDLVGTPQKMISELSIPNYQVANVRYNEADDELDVLLISYFDHMPDITVNLKKYRYYTNTVTKASVVGDTHYLSDAASSRAELLINGIYVELKSRLKGEHDEKDKALANHYKDQASYYGHVL